MECLQKTQQKQSEKITSLKMLLFLLLYSEKLPGGEEDVLLPEQLTKNHTVTCLTYGKNTKKTMQRQSFGSSRIAFAWMWCGIEE